MSHPVISSLLISKGLGELDLKSDSTAASLVGKSMPPELGSGVCDLSFGEEGGGICEEFEYDGVCSSIFGDV